MENALPEGVVQELERLLDAERAQQVEDSVVDRKGFGGAHASGFSQANTLQTEPSFQQMVTNVRVLPKVVDIMGTNISMYHCPCIVTPATGEDPPTDYESVPPFGYHQDSGMQADCEFRPAPRFSLKAGYYLNDMSEPGRGNTWVVPVRYDTC